MKPLHTILIVDDDPSLTRTMSLILEHAGYLVTTAASGSEALELAQAATFDLAFLDIKLPGIDGVETLRQLRQLRPDATVVMMTAYSLDHRIRDALRAGAHGVLRKPVEMEEVLGLIRRVLATSGEMLILIVEDDVATRTTLKNILLHKGYGVGEAGTGEEAVELVKSNGYDVILLDLRLPVMDGLQTYLAIQEVDPKAVVLLVTAYRDELDDLVRAALSRNVRKCLDKPLEMAEVLLTLEQIRREVRP